MLLYSIHTVVKPRSILLPKIHKTLIAQHQRSLFSLYVKCLWFNPIGLWIPILLVYYHSLVYSLEHGTAIITPYCTIMTSDTMVSPS